MDQALEDMSELTSGMGLADSEKRYFEASQQVPWKRLSQGSVMELQTYANDRPMQCTYSNKDISVSCESGTGGPNLCYGAVSSSLVFQSAWEYQQEKNQLPGMCGEGTFRAIVSSRGLDSGGLTPIAVISCSSFDGIDDKRCRAALSTSSNSKWDYDKNHANRNWIELELESPSIVSRLRLYIEFQDGHVEAASVRANHVGEYILKRDSHIVLSFKSQKSLELRQLNISRVSPEMTSSRGAVYCFDPVRVLMVSLKKKKSQRRSNDNSGTNKFDTSGVW